MNADVSKRILWAGRETGDLLKFLKPFSEANKELALWLRSFVWDMYPQCYELIYDNYNALAFGWSITDRQMHLFCSVALYGKITCISDFIMARRSLIRKKSWKERVASTGILKYLTKKIFRKLI